MARSQSFLTIVVLLTLVAACVDIGIGDDHKMAFGQSDSQSDDPSARKLSLEELRRLRREAAHRRVRVIMNNDGCDVLYFPKDEEATVENFLAKRTTPLAGTHVGAVAFCPTSSGFGHFTHDTQAGTLLTRQGYDFEIQLDARNIAKELIDQGTDCLAAVVEFGHAHNMEVFWSLRMNDTHDVAHRPDKPYFLYPTLKVEHPQWLVGEVAKRTPHGRWSSVDYARPEIRELAFAFIEEVCRDYDVDGVELDFFRHLCYFKSTAHGGTASDEERAMMTDLMHRVRVMTEEVGLERGRPILVTTRVPDSVGYCRDMGFDIERWLQDDLVDRLITTCYFRLNPWEYSVELGHKYDVPVYPCLSDSRVRGETRFHRSSEQSYRGRAMNAWAAGADGLHLFNLFDPNAPMWSELGDPETLLTRDKLYFVNVRDGDPRSFLAGGREYRTVSVFGPSHPQLITTSRPTTLDITLGDDLLEARRRRFCPQVKLHIESPGIQSAEPLCVKFNGIELTGGVVSEDAASDGWIDYPVPSACVKQGKNQVELALKPLPLSPDEWSIVYDGGTKPKRPWRRDPGSERTHEEVVDGALLIADRGDVSGDYLHYRHAWGNDPDGKATVEARVKVKSGSSFLIVANGIGGERLCLWPDRIELHHHHKLQYKMDTTADFHCYRMELDGRDLKVYVDDELRIDAPGVLGPRSGYSRNEMTFGAANSGMMGEAYWASVKARATGGLACRDLVVSVAYQEE